MDSEIFDHDIRDSATGAIVVGVDGSTGSDEALDWAAGSAALEHRALLVLHATNSVVASSLAYVYADGVDHDDVVRRIGADGRELAERTAERVRASAPAVEVRSLSTPSDARHALLEASQHASMVVVGSRGRGRVSSLLLGSVGAAVSKHADCPVVVVRPGSTEHAGGIVVGVDGRHSSDRVLEFAFREASWRRRPLTVLHTHVDDIALAVGLHTMGDPRDTEDAVRSLAEAVAGYQEKFPDVAVTRVVRGEEAYAALLSTEPDASLVVVGRRRHGGPLGALHAGVATTVIEHARTAVAVVPQS